MKTFLPIVALLTFSFLSAQEPSEILVIEKGTWNLTGNASLSFEGNKSNYNQLQNVSENSSHYLVLAPSFGYALKNDIVIGVGLEYGNQKGENSNTGFDTDNRYTNKNQSIGLTPYIRGYKGIGKQLSLYLQAEAGYSRFWNTSNQNGEDSNNDVKGNNVFIGIRPGITYFLNKKLAIESTIGSLSYSFGDRKPEEDRDSYSKSTNFSVALVSDLFFGIAYYF
ncbi:outer membrane beta-barrel protein [Maribacter sp. ACAM166]|uniref:outer membrane beta-barrel protein n=1 Tax=Maribacter sp. ACAM166 TaxID=2508996 RepID=UPI0010FD9E42|nr:outer membrane beta-barrel protein [Maribacter sp. ACAM166]TLP79259.1 hypothetical protein ES765_10870 [Maribacter sp. ACAM166]